MRLVLVLVLLPVLVIPADCAAAAECLYTA
jgi:hypothetical protein